MTGSVQPTIVFVHGAFADASGFAGVIRELTTSGHEVLAPPNSLRSLAFDAAAVGTAVRAIGGPVLLVGHSCGGAVITQASADLDNVVGLVYVAAFGLEVGESCASVQGPFPPSMLATTSAPTPYDAPGAPQGPDLYIAKAQFRATFCADVPVDTAAVMYATQRPLSVAALTENATAAGWHTKPSWYLVSNHDNAIPRDAERFMAQRMGQRRRRSTGRTPRSSPNRWLSHRSSRRHWLAEPPGSHGQAEPRDGHRTAPAGAAATGRRGRSGFGHPVEVIDAVPAGETSAHLVGEGEDST